MLSIDTRAMPLHWLLLLIIIAITAASGLWMHRMDVIATSTNRDGAFVLDRWSQTVEFCSHTTFRDKYASRCTEFYPATWDAVRQAADIDEMLKTYRASPQ